MKRIWKYVRKVERHLPLSKRIPVGGAIYAELRAQVKARRDELGRDLSDDEVDAITRSCGEPREVAGRTVACDAGRRPLVDRYLAAVGRHLPQDKAHDILAEMREAIESQIDALEEEAGGELDADGVSEVLKGFGPPMVAASGYAERDRLIGRDIYPFFWPTARALVGVVAAAAILFAAISTLSAGEWVRFVPRALSNFFELGLPAFASMMVVFIILDRTDAGKKIAANWSPKSLPESHIAKPKPLFDSIIGLGFDVLFILWWARIVDFSGLAGDREASVQLNWAGAWGDYHAVILALACLSAAAHLWDLVHPGWSRLRSATSIAGHLVGAYVFARLAASPPLLVEGPGAVDFPDEAVRALGWANASMQMALGVITLLMLGGLVVESWRMTRSLTENLPNAPIRA